MVNFAIAPFPVPAHFQPMRIQLIHRIIHVELHPAVFLEDCTQAHLPRLSRLCAGKYLCQWTQNSLEKTHSSQEGRKNSTSHTCKGKLTLKDGVVTNFLNETNKTGQKREQKS